VTAAAGPNGHVRDLAPDMAPSDGRLGTELLHFAGRGRLVIGHSVPSGHVRDLARGMAERDASEGDSA
jgi:hypothetical protein